MITKRITIVGVFVLCSLLAGGRSQTAPAPLTNIAGPAYGTRVVADTQFSEKHSAANAVDGRLEPGEGCWYSQDWTQLPCALTFTLDGEEEIRQVVLHQARWNGNMYHTKEFALETSADGKTWTRVATGELADDNEAKAVLDVNLRTRWLRRRMRLPWQQAYFQNLLRDFGGLAVTLRVTPYNLTPTAERQQLLQAWVQQQHGAAPPLTGRDRELQVARLAPAVQLAPHGDAALGETDFLAHLPMDVPASCRNGWGDEL